MNLRANAVVFVFGEERRVRGGRGRLRGVVRRGNFAANAVRDWRRRRPRDPRPRRRPPRVRPGRAVEADFADPARAIVPRGFHGRVAFGSDPILWVPSSRPSAPAAPARAPERSRRGVRGAGGDARQHRSNRRSGTHAPRANHSRHAAFHECEDDRLERWTETVRALQGRARRRVRRRSRRRVRRRSRLGRFGGCGRRGSRARRFDDVAGNDVGVPPAVSTTTVSPAVSSSLALKILCGDGERAQHARSVRAHAHVFDEGAREVPRLAGSRATQ